MGIVINKICSLMSSIYTCKSLSFSQTNQHLTCSYSTIDWKKLHRKDSQWVYPLSLCKSQCVYLSVSRSLSRSRSLSWLILLWCKYTCRIHDNVFFRARCAVAFQWFPFWKNIHVYNMVNAHLLIISEHCNGVLYNAGLW